MRVAVQQRHRLYREGLCELLGAERDLRVVGAAETSAELVAMCEGEDPDVAVLEWESTAPPPRQTARRLRRRIPSLALVVLSERADAPDAEVSRLLGAVVVRRGDGLAGIVEAIRSPRLAEVPKAWATRRADQPRPLTPRERAILALIGAGYTSQEVAARLHISRKTVDNHKQRVFIKLAVQNQAHAVSVAIRRGMLIPEPFVDAASAS